VEFKTERANTADKRIQPFSQRFKIELDVKRSSLPDPHRRGSWPSWGRTRWGPSARIGPGRSGSSWPL